MTKISVYLVTLVIALTSIVNSYSQSKTIEIDHFDEATISPHIQVTFVKGDKEAVIIESASVSKEKINIEVVRNSLKIYLDDAKMVTKNVTVKENGWKRKKPIYKGTQVVATVIYKELKELSIGGEETIVCKSAIEREDFRLKIYGESRVTLNAVALNSFIVSIYGESNLEIKDGYASNQKYTVYGEATINALEVQNQNTKITTYGESSFRVQVEDRLKVTAFGEATVAYQGNPSISKGIEKTNSYV